jgi:AcrR family transcriptional regulator
VDHERAAEVEGSIIEAARDLMAEGGLDRLSMRHVAERVGLSATALYHYFENKEALVRRVVEDAFRRFGSYLAAAAERHPEGSVERLYALGEAYLRFAVENETYFRVLFSLQHPDPRTLEDLPHGGGFNLLRESVAQAMEAGNIRAADPDLVSLYLWSVAHGIITIALACRLDECAGESVASLPSDPVEMYAAFREFIRSGIGVQVRPEWAVDVAAEEGAGR